MIVNFAHRFKVIKKIGIDMKQINNWIKAIVFIAIMMLPFQESW